MNIDLNKIRKLFKSVNNSQIESIDDGEQDIWWHLYIVSGKQFDCIESFLAELAKKRLETEWGTEEECIEGELKEYLENIIVGYSRLVKSDIEEAKKITRDWQRTAGMNLPQAFVNILNTNDDAGVMIECIEEGLCYEIFIHKNDCYGYIVFSIW